MISFCLYGTPHQHVKLATLLAMDDVVALAENSGCEGTYIEVARWNPKHKTYQRYAFEKVFGGEAASLTDDKTAEDWNSVKTAEHIASLINHHDKPSIIHRLPVWEEGGIE